MGMADHALVCVPRGWVTVRWFYQVDEEWWGLEEPLVVSPTT